MIRISWPGLIPQRMKPSLGPFADSTWKRAQSQQVSGPGVEGQSAVFNPSSLPLANCPS